MLDDPKPRLPPIRLTIEIQTTLHASWSPLAVDEIGEAECPVIDWSGRSNIDVTP
jgi:hypothetical protein